MFNFINLILRITRTRNCEIFENFVQRTDRKDLIDCVRKNILAQVGRIPKNEKLSKTSQLSPKFQRFLRAMALKDKIQLASSTNQQVNGQEESHLADIQNKSKNLM